FYHAAPRREVSGSSVSSRRSHRMVVRPSHLATRWQVSTQVLRCTPRCPRAGKTRFKRPQPFDGRLVAGGLAQPTEQVGCHLRRTVLAGQVLGKWNVVTSPVVRFASAAIAIVAGQKIHQGDEADFAEEALREICEATDAVVNHRRFEMIEQFKRNGTGTRQ